MIQEHCLAQQTAIASGTAETTIITADANNRNDLVGLILTSKNAAIATLTIKDGTAGVTKMVLDYPPTAAAIPQPVVVMLPRPIKAAAKNANWTATMSANASGINITALYTQSS